MRKRTFTLSAAVPSVALLLCFAVSGCRSKPPTTETRKPSSDGFVSSVSGYDIFDLRSHPDAIVMQPIDPATLTPSQRQFGISPRLDPKVQYQPDIILMEHGDQAIRSLASNGLVWTFDANAPHVNEFAMDKIVFATGQAVGRIAMLKREGDSVQVILLPVQFHDLIAKGSFVIDSPIDINKMIPYVYPDFPQPVDQGIDMTSVLPIPGVDHWKGSIVVSHIDKRGKWSPVTLTTVSANGRRKRFQRIGRRWTPVPAWGTALPPAPLTRERSPGPPRLVRSNYQLSVPNLPAGASNFCTSPTARGKGMGMPGVPGPQIVLPVLPDCNPPVVPNLPRLQVDDLEPSLVAESGGVGVSFSYEKQGIHLKAAALLNFSGSGVKAFMTAGSGVVPKDCGIQLTGAVGVVLYIKSGTDQSWRVNIRKIVELPVILSIPIAGPVPLSVSFEQAIAITTGFSAKANSVLNAQGVYGITGDVKAGYFDSHWGANPSLRATAKVDIGNSVEGISLGIGSLLLGAHMRVMLGLGNGPLSFGVFAKLVYTGTILKAPDEALPCRQGTMVVTLKSGVGYSIPEAVVKAVNALLSLFTDKKLEARGTVLDGPEQNLITKTTQYPDGCATPK